LSYDPILYILGDKMFVDYQKGIVTIEGLQAIAGDGSTLNKNWPAQRMEIKENKLVFYLGPRKIKFYNIGVYKNAKNIKAE
jgi:hypothetical protein